MPRNHLAVLLILLAKLVLWSHAVIPHHHHEDHVCFHATECRDGHDKPDDGARGAGNEDPPPCCALTELSMAQPVSGRYGLSCPLGGPLSNLSPQTPTLPSPLLRLVLPVQTGLAFRQAPPSGLACRVHERQAHGLRAPPVI